MRLAYQAIDGRGQSRDDTVQAATVKEGVESLRRQGLFVTRISAEKEEGGDEAGSAVDAGELARYRLPLSKLVLFTRQMSMLLTSGSALVPALTAIGKQLSHPRQQRMLAILREELEKGSTLCDALGKFPGTFEASYCAVVAAGESSATLPRMFERLATVLGKRRGMRNKVLGALIYPCLLTGLSAGILGIMMFFVVPRFAAMFDTLGVELPQTTKLMMHSATGLTHSWPFLAALVVAVIVGMYVLLRTDRGVQCMANVQIRIPLVGRLLSRLIQAQTFRVLGMLLEARVGLLEALELARRVTRNDRYQALYDQLGESVTRGESVHSALESSDLLSPSIVQAVRTGEESGRLGEAIGYVADVLDEENGEMLGVLTKLIEPLILIGMGLVVGTVAISLFMPLFDMTAAM